MEWISVEDRLPEVTESGSVNISKYVLVYPDIVKARYEELTYSQWSKVSQWYSPLLKDTIYVTHWMPLPEKPKTK